MTLIRKSLYKDLVAVRDEIFKELQELTNKLEEVSSVLSQEEKFVENFDTSQDALKDSISNLEELITKTKQEVKDLEENIEKLKIRTEKAKDELTEATTVLKEEEDKLQELKDSSAPEAQIKAQEAKVQEAKSVVSSKESTIEGFRDEVDKSKKLADDKHKIIEDSESSITENNQQLADNAERKANAAEKIADLTSSKESTEADKDRANAQYTDFLTKNQDTINTFEDQQLRRDANIPKHNTNQAFSREPADAAVVVQADEVIVEVVKDELKPQNPEDEKILEQYIEKGRKEEVNPLYLSAAEARDLSLSAIWSTKDAALAIRNACKKGNFEVVFSSLPNNVIYALSEAGYVMHMTDVDEDKRSEIIVSWANYKAQEA